MIRNINMKFSPILLALSSVLSVYLTARFGFSIPLYTVLFLLCIVYSAIKRCIELSPLAVLAAMVLCGISYSFFFSDTVHKSIKYTDIETTLCGTVVSSAQKSTSDDNYRYSFYVKSLTENGESIPINDTVLLTSPNKLKCGDSVTIKGTLAFFREQMNENGFDMKNYYESQNIFTRIYSEDIAPCEKIRVFSPSVLCGKFRDATDKLIYKYYKGDGAAVLSAVLTGNTHNFSAEFNKILNKTAFRHLYHPAFLHILIISHLIGLTTGFLPKKKRTALFIVLLLLYSVLNCAQVGFVRCLVASALTAYFGIKNGYSHYPDTLAWLVFVTALLFPVMLFNTGFILSLSAGIIMWAFLPYFAEKFRRLPKILRRTSAAAVVSAFIYTPISLFFYNGICIYAFLVSFITIPAVLIILITAYPTFAALLLFGAAMPVKPYLDFAVMIMLRLPRLISIMPLSSVIIPSLPPSGKLLVISLIFSFYYYTRSNKKFIGFLLTGGGFTLALTASVILCIGTTDFIFVNVGQGDGSIIHTAYGATVLIDGGGGTAYSEYNPGESVFLPYLQSHGYLDIDAAFISHFHDDHAEGIIATIKALRVKNVFVPSPEPDMSVSEISLMKETETVAKEYGAKLHYIEDDTVIKFDKGLNLYVYAPDESIRISNDGNNSSLLIKAEYENTSVLYTGDMTAYAEHRFLARGIRPDADILKVAHHGSKSSTDADWLNTVKPKISVISCGKDNVYGHPDETTLNALEGTAVLRTDLQGDIKITADKNGIKKITTFR